MTAKSGTEKEKKQTEHQQSLKGTLAEVLQKSKQEAGSGAREEIPRPAAAEPPQAKPVAPAVTPEQKPFEVSEETLQKGLKGES